MRAIFAASATTATLGWVRARIARSHDPTAVLLLVNEGIADRAPWISILRRYLLPRFVMSRSFGLPPVVACRGTRPNHAARSRPLSNVAAANWGYQGGGIQRSDAGNACQSPGAVVGPRHGCELGVKGRDAAVQLFPARTHVLE